MNRAERRRLERQGKKLQKDPAYVVKASSSKEALLKNPMIKEMIDQEINKRILELDKQYAIDMDTVVLWTMRQYGWGYKRLRRLYQDMFRLHRQMRERYEIQECFPERQLLKEQGIDVEAWFNEMFQEDGTYKEPLEDQP